MLSLELPKEVEERLESLAARTGRSKDDLAREAIQELLDEQEDYLLAVARLQDGRPGIPLDEAERRLDLDR